MLFSRFNPQIGCSCSTPDGNCGSCWAVAATTVFADQICIAGGAPNLTLATEYMLDCDGNENGCVGGYLDDAWLFLKDIGVPVEDCYPYQHCMYPALPGCIKPGEKGDAPIQPRPLPICPSTCTTSGNRPDLLRAKSAYAVGRPGDVEAMQWEMLTRGSIEVAFFVFSDFLNYKSGTYVLTSAGSGPPAGHAVRILAWGVDEKGLPY